MKKRLRKIFNKARKFLFIYRMEKRKFNIGSGGTDIGKDWYATDIDTLDITKKEDWNNLLYFLKLDNIVAEHVWEHLSDKDTELANRNCFRFLKRKGVLRIAVPDGYHPNAAYIEWVRPGGNGPGADDHKILYNYKIMKDRLEKAGFEIRLLEYWDENGDFHFTDWTNEGGYIMRSRRFDKRNSGGELLYTSLIVDAIRP
jgi:predicted SAM-dependent methyltransferase